MSDPASLGAGGLTASVIEAARRRYDDVQERIALAAARAGRSADEITLVGVAKRQPRERILGAIAAGVRVLGQSYIQEARRIRPSIEAALAGHPATTDVKLEWRMVGRLQRNKAGLAVRLFDAIETVDRPELALSLSRQAETHRCPLDVLIQVSLCGEPQKGGCDENALIPLTRQILEFGNLRLAGLMTIPAANDDPEAARPVFRRLYELREAISKLAPNLESAELSMGMSGDLEVAIEEGATLVRVGTALFGDRVDPIASNTAG